MKDQRMTSEELVHKLADLFDEIDLEEGEVDAILCEAGYDPDEIGRKMQAFADQALTSPFSFQIRKRS